MYQLKTTHIYHLTASVGQDPGMALLCPLTSGFLMDWNQGKLWAMVQMGFFKKTCFYVHGTAFQHLVLCGQSNLGSQMLTAVGCRPPLGPSHTGQSIMAASSPCSPRSQWREPTSNMEVTVFCHLILEEVSPDLCHSLLVASLSLGSDMLEGREEHKALGQEGVLLQAPRKLNQPQLPHRGPQSWLDSNKAE